MRCVPNIAKESIKLFVVVSKEQLAKVFDNIVLLRTQENLSLQKLVSLNILYAFHRENIKAGPRIGTSFF